MGLGFELARGSCSECILTKAEERVGRKFTLKWERLGVLQLSPGNWERAGVWGKAVVVPWTRRLPSLGIPPGETWVTDH